MPHNKIKALHAECPECDELVNFETMPRLGQAAVCAACGTNLEVAYLYPIMLDWADSFAPQEYEDGVEDYD